RKLDPAQQGIGIFLTVAIALASVYGGIQTLRRHPLFLDAQPVRLEAFAPSPSDHEWSVMPLFYSLGAWPKEYLGHPVFYELPYEKGPPSHFVGKVVMRWEMPNIKLTVEGPRTPVPGIQRQEIQDCAQKISTLKCFFLRQAELGRHLLEMKRVGPTAWK